MFFDDVNMISLLPLACNILLCAAKSFWEQEQNIFKLCFARQSLAVEGNLVGLGVHVLL